ncbi:MAG: universal stress protein [Methylobacillus sp.]|jgi:nucleotide-binding universal stress UspA family protein|nr:universal stress protein [Methylobacillus sp.]
MYKHILASTDGSDLAQKGVDQAITISKAMGSKLTIITVTEPYPLQSAATPESWGDAQKEHADAALKRATDAAAKAGVDIEIAQVAGAPAEVIVHASKSLNCDLIVMASHGRRGVKRLLLGSQTAEVVAHSETPVMVVR